ncbi:MAG: efflux RND transporter periplasmic adaptor subunit [Chitinophagaceae bacterium]
MRCIKIFISALIFLIYTSCNSHEEIAPKEDKAVPDSIAKQVVTAPVTMDDVSDVIKLNGKIIPNETMQAKIYALVSGRVKSVSVELGDHVRKGQQLAVLQSTEVAGAANDLSVAQATVDIAQKTLQSTEEMFKGNLATEREVTGARQELNIARSGLNKARQISSITGGHNATYTLTAPITGSIIEKTITNNSEVRQDNSTNLFTVADLSTVWIIANVYEADINHIHIGDAVTVNTLADPEKNYVGKIDKIYDVLDPANRTMKVRISMQNKNDELKPEMFATIIVKGKSSGKMLSIPSGAVVLDNSKRYVVVKEGADSLAIKEIQIIKREGDRTFISGLTQGQQVVINSQVFLYEALNSK